MQLVSIDLWIQCIPCPFCWISHHSKITMFPIFRVVVCSGNPLIFAQRIYQAICKLTSSHICTSFIPSPEPFVWAVSKSAKAPWCHIVSLWVWHHLRGCTHNVLHEFEKLASVGLSEIAEEINHVYIVAKVVLVGFKFFYWKSRVILFKLFKWDYDIDNFFHSRISLRYSSYDIGSKYTTLQFTLMSIFIRADFRFASSHWETSLQNNAVREPWEEPKE